MNISLSTILSTYRPTDMLDSAPDDAKEPGILWPHVFGSIERNHVGCDPAYWARFVSSVAKRQHQPICISTVCGQPYVVNGHHRVWALVKSGKTSVRARWI